jgi:stage II sporulation protein AA (anti-sigma F factor antagonist)
MRELASLSLGRSHGIVLAEVSGEIDLSNAEDLRDEIALWATNEDRGVIVDLTSVTYADSAGMNLLFVLARQLKEHGQIFGAVVPSESQPRRAFDVVGMADQIPMFETLAEAQTWAERGR